MGKRGISRENLRIMIEASGAAVCDDVWTDEQLDLAVIMDGQVANVALYAPEVNEWFIWVMDAPGEYKTAKLLTEDELEKKVYKL